MGYEQRVAQRVDAEQSPVLAGGRHDAYIRTVDTGRDRLVVDLVQVFQGNAAVTAAIQDGKSRDTAQYLSVWVRNQSPRLRTLPLARDLRLDLRGGDCEAPLSRQLAKLATDARLMSGPIHTYNFTLTVQGGAVHQVQKFLATWNIAASRGGGVHRAPDIPSDDGCWTAMWTITASSTTPRWPRRVGRWPAGEWDVAG
jgi:hypothetical protein